MKDPGGHGSNGGNNSALTKVQGPAPAIPHGSGKPTGGHNFTQIHGGAPLVTPPPVSSNAQAAQSLFSSLKSTQAPVHSAMASRPSPDGGSAS